MGKNITCETYCGDKANFKVATSGIASHLCVGSKTKASVVGLMCFGRTVEGARVRTFTLTLSALGENHDCHSGSMQLLGWMRSL